MATSQAEVESLEVGSLACEVGPMIHSSIIIVYI
jgi:hypothetical protein